MGDGRRQPDSLQASERLPWRLSSKNLLSFPSSLKTGYFVVLHLSWLELRKRCRVSESIPGDG